MFTNQMRFTGMSGLDTHGIVEQLMRAHSMRLDRMRQDRDLQRWRMENMREQASNLSRFAFDQLTLSTSGGRRPIRLNASWNALTGTPTTNGGAPIPGVNVTMAAGGAGTTTATQIRVTDIARGDIFRTDSALNLNRLHGSAQGTAGIADMFANGDFLDQLGTTNEQFRDGITFEIRGYEITLEQSEIFAPSGAINNNSIVQRINAQLVDEDSNYEVRFLSGRLQMRTRANTTAVPPTTAGTWTNMTDGDAANIHGNAEPEFIRFFMQAAPTGGTAAENNAVAAQRVQQFRDDFQYIPAGGSFNVVLNGISRTVDITAAQIEALTEPSLMMLDTDGITYIPADDAYRANRLVDMINDELLTLFGNDQTLISDNTHSEYGTSAQRIRVEIYNDNLRFVTSAHASHVATITDGTGRNAGTLAALGFGISTPILDADGDPTGDYERILPQGGLTTFINPNNMRVSDFLGAGSDSFEINGVTFINGVRDPDNTTAGNVYLGENATIRQLMNAVNGSSANARMTFNDRTGEFTIESTRTGVIDGGLDMSGDFIDLAFGAAADRQQLSTASDARIIIGYGTPNEEIRSQATNNFNNINGMNITLDPNIVSIPAAGYINIDINMTRDVAPIRTMIEDFLAEFNSIQASLREQTETRRPTTTGTGGRNFFHPLTDEQRGAMSDREIEQWEEQARTGILHRDPILRRIFSDLHSAITGPVTLADGRTISLADIGIRTDPNLENFGQIIIMDEARFNAALEDRLDDVMQLFTQQYHGPANSQNARNARNPHQGLAERINTIVVRETSVTGNIARVAGLANMTQTHENNTMGRRLREQETRIENFIRTLERRESAYFARFSRLEVAMMQSQSQMDFMMQMMWPGMQ